MHQSICNFYQQERCVCEEPQSSGYEPVMEAAGVLIH